MNEIPTDNITPPKVIIAAIMAESIKNLLQNIFGH